MPLTVDASSSSKPTTQHPHEPFGQEGISRYFFSFCCFISFVCMLCSLAMWFRSHRVMDEVWKSTHDGRLVVRSVYGRVVMQKLVLTIDYGAADGWNYSQAYFRRPISDGWRDSWAKRFGFGWGVDPGQGNVAEVRWIRIRWPLIAAALSILPGYWLIRKRTQARLAESDHP